MYQITQEKLIFLLKAIIIIVILYFIIKHTFKIALTIIGILIILQIGFMLTGDDLNERFLLGKYLDEGTNTKIISFFNDFRERGNKIAIVDKDKIYNTMLEGVEKGAELVIDKIDIDIFAESLAKKIYKDGIEVDVEQLKETILTNIPDLKDEEIELIINKILEYKETGEI